MEHPTVLGEDGVVERIELALLGAVKRFVGGAQFDDGAVDE